MVISCIISGPNASIYSRPFNRSAQLSAYSKRFGFRFPYVPVEQVKSKHRSSYHQHVWQYDENKMYVCRSLHYSRWARHTIKKPVPVVGGKWKRESAREPHKSDWRIKWRRLRHLTSAFPLAAAPPRLTLLTGTGHELTSPVVGMYESTSTSSKSQFFNLYLIHITYISYRVISTWFIYQQHSSSTITTTTTNNR